MGSSRFVRKVAIGLLACGTVIGLTAAAGAASAAPQGRHPLDGSMPKWLHQAHDNGASSSAQQMNFGILLGMHALGALQQRIDVLGQQSRIVAAPGADDHFLVFQLCKRGRIAAQCLAAPPRIEVITPEKVDVR